MFNACLFWVNLLNQVIFCCCCYLAINLFYVIFSFDTIFGFCFTLIFYYRMMKKRKIIDNTHWTINFHLFHSHGSKYLNSSISGQQSSSLCIQLNQVNINIGQSSCLIMNVLLIILIYGINGLKL